MQSRLIVNPSHRSHPRMFLLRCGVLVVVMAIASLAFAVCNPPQGSGCQDCLYQPPIWVGGQAYTYDVDPNTGNIVVCSTGPCTPFTC